MKIKTNLKVGKGTRNFLSGAGDFPRSAGQKTTSLLTKIKDSLTNVKFWTWPF